MKSTLIVLLLFCVFQNLALGQIGVADPVTSNAQIDFYGRVVDQNGKPLSHAKVDLSVTVGYLTSSGQLSTEYNKSILTTDLSGDFEVTGKAGHSVEIESIILKGYDLSRTTARLYPYSWSANIFHPDPKNPVIFVLWNEGMNKTLITDDKHFDVVPDGRPYVISFVHHTVSSGTNINGDFQFRFRRPQGVNKRDRFDWTFSIDGENGNTLQPIDKDYFEMHFAPPRGFAASYEETHVAGDASWRRGGEKRFYFKLNLDGGYGKMSLHWDTVAGANGPRTNDVGIRIQYTVNPNGATLAE